MADNRVALGSPPVLTLDITRRLFPDGDNFYDRNMLAVNLTMVAGRFQGFIETQFRADELARFRDLFREMYQHLRGEWHQEFLASGLDLRMKGDGLGHFEMVCIADDQGGTGNKPTFGIDFDQTEIPEMLASLDEVVANFPVRD